MSVNRVLLVMLLTGLIDYVIIGDSLVGLGQYLGIISLIYWLRN